MDKFYKKKPELKDYGLTEEDVNKNEFAKNNRQRIINENSKIDENAKKYGVTTGLVIGIIGIIITAAAGVAQIGAAAVIIGIIAGVVVCGVTKSKKQEIPTYSSIISKKYKEYQDDLNKYNKDLALFQKQEKEKTAKKKEELTKRAVKRYEEIKEKNAKGIRKPPLIDKVVLTSQVRDLEKGMIVNHPKFGHGKVMSVNPKEETCYIQFDDDLSLKMIMYKLVPIEILEIPHDPKPKRVRDVLTQPNEKKKADENPITKVYNNGIELTKSQEKLFNEMYKESQKYCLELQVNEWKQYVGVGIIGQEHLRYWLTQRQGKVYVKFADTQKTVPLSAENRFDLINYTRQVNESFEADPEKYMLAAYKRQLEKASEPVEEKTSLPVEENIEQTSTTDDIFGVDEDLDDDMVETDEEPADVQYDRTIFAISDKTITKFFGVEDQSVYEIPDGVEEIGTNSFMGNNYVYELKIPSTVKRIKDRAFKDCKKIRILELPSSIVEIGADVFVGCDNLETIFCYTKAVRKLLVNIPKHIDVVCLEM